MQIPHSYNQFDAADRKFETVFSGATAPVKWPNGVGDLIVPGTTTAFKTFVPIGALHSIVTACRLYAHSDDLGIHPVNPTFEFADTTVDTRYLQNVLDDNLSCATRCTLLGGADAPHYGDPSAPGSSHAWEMAAEDPTWQRQAAKPLSHWISKVHKSCWPVDKILCLRATKCLAKNLPMIYLLNFYRRAVRGKPPTHAHIIGLFQCLSAIDRFLEAMILTWIMRGAYGSAALSNIPDPKDWSGDAAMVSYLSIDVYGSRPVPIPRPPDLETMARRLAHAAPLFFDHVMRLRQASLTSGIHPAWVRIRDQLARRHEEQMSQLEELGPDDEEGAGKDDLDTDPDPDADQDVANIATLLGAAKTPEAPLAMPDEGRKDPAVTGVTPTQYMELQVSADKCGEKAKFAESATRAHTLSTATLRVHIGKLERTVCATLAEQDRLQEQLDKLHTELACRKQKVRQLKAARRKYQTFSTHAKRKLTTINSAMVKQSRCNS
jgi:hypothetical protein